VLGNGTGTERVFGAVMCRPVEPHSQEWLRSISILRKATIACPIDYLIFIISRIHDCGQLLAVFSRIVNIFCLVRRLGAESDQAGPIGDLP